MQSTRRASIMKTREEIGIMRGLILMLAGVTSLLAQGEKIRVIAFGAHPDDCDIRAAGTAALFARAGARGEVRLGDQRRRGPSDDGRRRAGRAPAGAKPRNRRGGWASSTKCSTITMASCCPRSKCASRSSAQIREWNADIVLAPRPNDYHPDHRYTGVLVQDAAYMVVVPNMVPGYAAAAQESGVSLLRGRFPAAQAVPSGHRDRDRRRVRQEDRRAGFARLAVLRMAAVGGRERSAEVPKDPAERKAWLKRSTNARRQLRRCGRRW